MSLMNAVMNGDASEVEELILKGDDPNGYPVLLDFYRPIAAASYHGYAECVDVLIRHGADIDVRDYDGMTPLMLACRRGHLKCAELLMKAGANPNIKNDLMFTAKDYCIGKGSSCKHLFEMEVV